MPQAPPRHDALPLTTGDDPLRGRRQLRLVRDLTVPLGSLWLGDMSTRDTPAPRCVRWLTELRLGVIVPNTPDAPEGEAARRSGRKGPPLLAMGDVPPRGSVLTPVLLMRPCLHRLIRRDKLDALWSDYLHHPMEVQARLSDLWVCGASAAQRDNLIPAPVQLDALDPIAEFDRAATWADALRSEHSAREVRRLLRRGPMALLSPALHPALRGDPSTRMLAAATAAVAELGALEATGSRRGPMDDLQVPAADVDLAACFPLRRPGPRGRRGYQAFVARLTLNGRLPPGQFLSPQDVEAQVRDQEERLDEWRRQQLRPKGRPWVLPDLECGHVLHAPEDAGRALDLDLLLDWALTFAEASPSLAALRTLGDGRLRWASWEGSPWLIRLGDEPVVHRARVEGLDEPGKQAVAKARAHGASWARDDVESEVCAWLVGGTAAQARAEVERAMPPGVRVHVDSAPRRGRERTRGQD